MVVNTTITSKNQTIEKVVNGKTYVYERVPYYNSKIQNTSYHYIYLGKKNNEEIKKVRSILPRRSLIHGPFIPLMKIVDALGIDDILKKHLTVSETDQVIAIAVSKIVRPLPLSSIETWIEGTSISMDVGLKSQRISELMDRIGSSDLYMQFSSALVSRINL
jgi:hypothetical protein